MSKKKKNARKQRKESDFWKRRIELDQFANREFLVGTKAQFLVDSYDGNGSDIDSKTMSLKEVHALNLKSYDCCRAICLGVFGFKNPTTGEWIEYGTISDDKKYGNKITARGMKIFEVIQWFPGLYHTPKMLSEGTGEKCLLDSSKVNTEVCKLRTAHYEDKATEHFIITKDGVAWPSDITWIAVLLLPFARKEHSEAVFITERNLDIQNSGDNNKYN